ncbi:MAG: DUF4126 domain-containing protein [Terriglobia bacterium]
MSNVKLGGAMMETLLSVAIGLGLSAACGFRVFVPLLMTGVTSATGHLRLAQDFQWMASTPALVTFSTATAAEILAYYIPWLDHFLDLLATPTAILAGVIASASVITELPPLVKWSVALIAGGSIAGIVQGTTVLTRVKSSALTGGLGNFLVSTLELAGSIVTAFLAIFVPLACLAILAATLWYVLRKAGRLVFGRRKVNRSV